MVVYKNNGNKILAPLKYNNKLYTLAYGKDTIYAKSTGIASVPTIYAKNNESRTVYVPNVTFVGNIQTESLYEPEKILGFTSANYCQTPITTFPAATASSWEWYFRFLQKGTGTYQRIYGQNKDWPSGVGISANGKIFLCLSTSTESYNIADNKNGTTILQDDTWYDLKVEFTGSAYNVYLNNNLELTVAKSTKLKSTSAWKIGYEAKANSGNSAFKGVLDLSQSYIKVDGSYWWQGTSGTVTVSKNSYDRKTEKIKRYI